MKKIIFALIVVLFFSVVYVKNELKKQLVLAEPVELVIPKGANTRIVAEILKSSGVVKNSLMFRFAVRLYRLDTKLKAGEYVFSETYNLEDVVKRIANGDILYRKITLPEGLTSKQMLDIIAAEPMLEGDISVNVQEGELLPETYSFVRGDTRNSIIFEAKNAMRSAVDEAWNNRENNLPIRSKDEMLVLASIIEKETAVTDERRLVASVFVNRLNKRMKLQTDPTVIYALTLGQKDLGRSLTRKDLKVDSPYNTYKYYGLPPKPICNPGVESIKAAVNPELSDYLYFVADGKGGHNFAVSLKQHNKNVRNWKNLK